MPTHTPSLILYTQLSDSHGQPVSTVGPRLQGRQKPQATLSSSYVLLNILDIHGVLTGSVPTHVANPANTHTSTLHDEIRQTTLPTPRPGYPCNAHWLRTDACREPNKHTLQPNTMEADKRDSIHTCIIPLFSLFSF